MSNQAQDRRVLPLNPDELEWLEHHRDLLAAIIEQESLQLPPDATVLDACDAVVRWWHSVPEDQRPDANLVVNAIGIGLGDALAEVFDLHWRIIEDEQGSSLSLWRAEPDMMVSPIDSVAKRFADSPDGFVSAFYDGLAPELEQIIEGPPR